MADITQPNIMIQVLIQQQTLVGQYNSALYYAYNDFIAAQQKDIDAAAQAQVDNWVQAIQNAPETTPPTDDDLLQSLADFTAVIASQLSNAVSDATMQDLQNTVTTLQANVTADLQAAQTALGTQGTSGAQGAQPPQGAPNA